MTVTPTPVRRRWAGLAVLSASLLLVVMDITLLNVALPEISADLKPDAVSLLWMVDVYSLVVAGLLVTVSALGDRWGRKKMLITGFAVFGVASTAILFAHTPGAVIAVRALLGVGGAMIMPSTLSMIRTLFTDGRERATALGIWAAMAAVGSALGPILGGVLLEHFPWQATFLVNVPIMVIAIVAGLILLPESRNPNPGRWDGLGALLSMAGMVALVYAIKHVAEAGIGDPLSVATLAFAAVTLTWFAIRTLRRPDPLLDLRLFRTSSFTAGTVTALTTELALAGMMLLMSQWMQLVRGFSPLETGVRLLPAAGPVGDGGARGWGARPELTLACRLSMGIAMLAMLLAL
ncbi:MAG: MFS transporter [Nonomuraea sp.]|nr:MFS transporter [Nonomuraea sp.]